MEKWLTPGPGEKYTNWEIYKLGHLVVLESKDTNKDSVVSEGLGSQPEGPAADIKWDKNNDCI